MGLDIGLIDIIKYNQEKRTIESINVEEKYNWNTDRLSIRKELNKHGNFKSLDLDPYENDNIVCRPTDFKNAYKWALSLKNKYEKKYIINILDILKSKESLYLEYCC